MNKLFFIFVLLPLLSCSAFKKDLVENEIKYGQVRFFGGVQGDIKWHDALIFSRASWFYGFNMYYDALIYKVDKNGPFMNWFSNTEQEMIKDCHPFLVTASYTPDSTKIAHTMFYDQLQQLGFKRKAIRNFYKSFRNHPSFHEWRLDNYTVDGFCGSKSLNELRIVFPSFDTVNITL